MCPLVQEVMLRRLKRDVMAELPPKRRQVVRLPRPKPADWPNQEVLEGKYLAPDVALHHVYLIPFILCLTSQIDLSPAWCCHTIYSHVPNLQTGPTKKCWRVSAFSLCCSASHRWTIQCT